MAISPKDEFSGKIDLSDPTGYPEGKAKDVTGPGTLNGTPWVALLLNDIFGFQQAILAEVAVVPTGTPDKVGASQYLDAIKTLIAAVATPNATELIRGKAEIATQPETDAEADDQRFVTPLKLGAWATANGFLTVISEGSNANGHFVHLSNGLKIQWLQTAKTLLSGASQSVPFPIAFLTSTPFVVVMDDDRTDPQINVGYSARSATGFTASNSGSGSSKNYTFFTIGV